MVSLSSSLPSLAHAGAEAHAVAICVFWLRTWVPACQTDSLGKLIGTQHRPMPSRFVTTLGMSSPLLF